MDNIQSTKIRTAASAAWWTLLLATLLISAIWLIYVWMVNQRAAWMQGLWAPGMTWETVGPYALWGVTVFKVFLWMLLTAAIWLSLWARGLKKAGL